MKKYYLISAFFLSAHICCATGSQSTGHKIYQSECADCHDGGFWGWIEGAPSINEKSEWEKYLAKDLEDIVKAALEGTEGGMDPKGGCEECTNEEIEMAVKYMVSQIN